MTTMIIICERFRTLERKSTLTELALHAMYVKPGAHKKTMEVFFAQCEENEKQQSFYFVYFRSHKLFQKQLPSSSANSMSGAQVSCMKQAGRTAGLKTWVTKYLALDRTVCETLTETVITERSSIVTQGHVV